MNIVVAIHSVYRRIWHCVQSTSDAIARTPQSCGSKDPERYSYCTICFLQSWWQKRGKTHDMTTSMYFDDPSKSGKEDRYPSGYLPLGKKLLHIMPPNPFHYILIVHIYAIVDAVFRLLGARIFILWVIVSLIIVDQVNIYTCWYQNDMLSLLVGTLQRKQLMVLSVYAASTKPSLQKVLPPQYCFDMPLSNK